VSAPNNLSFLDSSIAPKLKILIRIHSSMIIILLCRSTYIYVTRALISINTIVICTFEAGLGQVT